MKDLKKHVLGLKIQTIELDRAIQAYEEKESKLKDVKDYIPSVLSIDFEAKVSRRDAPTALNNIINYEKYLNLDESNMLRNGNYDAQILSTALLTSLNTKVQQAFQIDSLYRKRDSLDLPDDMLALLNELHGKVVNKEGLESAKFNELLNDVRARDQLKHIIANEKLAVGDELKQIEKYKDIIMNKKEIPAELAQNLKIQIHPSFMVSLNIEREAEILKYAKAKVIEHKAGVEGNIDKALNEMIPLMYKDISSKLEGQEKAPRREMIARVVVDYMKKAGVYEDNKKTFTKEERTELTAIVKEIDKAMQSRKDVKEHPIKGFADRIRHFIAEFITGADYLLQNSKTTEEKLGKAVKEGKFAAKIRAEKKSTTQIER